MVSSEDWMPQLAVGSEAITFAGIYVRSSVGCMLREELRHDRGSNVPGAMSASSASNNGANPGHGARIAEFSLITGELTYMHKGEACGLPLSGTHYPAVCRGRLALLCCRVYEFHPSFAPLDDHLQDHPDTSGVVFVLAEARFERRPLLGLEAIRVRAAWSRH